MINLLPSVTANNNMSNPLIPSQESVMDRFSKAVVRVFYYIPDDMGKFFIDGSDVIKTQSDSCLGNSGPMNTIHF